jgi:hypothetical protein
MARAALLAAAALIGAASAQTIPDEDWGYVDVRQVRFLAAGGISPAES